MHAVEKIERLVAVRSRPQVGWHLRYSLEEGFWSPEIFQMLGVDGSERAPPAGHAFGHVPPCDRRAILETTQRARRQRHGLNLHYRVQIGSGPVRVLQSRAQPVVARKGGAIPYVGVLIDVTPEVEAQAALALLRAELHSGTAIAEEPNRKPVPPVPFHSSVGALAPAKLRRVCALIEDRLHTNLSLDEMARCVGLSRSFFLRAFKQATGETPHQFILRLRLERALAEITHRPSTKIATVAIECGFFDQAHLTRHFRMRFGITPGEALRQFVLSGDRAEDVRSGIETEPAKIRSLSQFLT